MPRCKYYEICGRDSMVHDALCILHSPLPLKHHDAFHYALTEHLETKGNDFRYFVFPGWASFFETTFHGDADFSNAEFSGGCDFSSARFTGIAKFFDVTFHKTAKFPRANFAQGADFRLATFTDWLSFANSEFSQEAYFSETLFLQEANFSRARFGSEAFFNGTKFSGGADFSGAKFAKAAGFFRARFLGRALFISGQDGEDIIPIFSGAVVDFREAILEPLDTLVFRGADLRQCGLVGTDLRKAEITDAKWPRIGGRFGVYDEIAALHSGETHSRPHIERLYRELKQNYEDRRDYERASDFHYGEKEMRRKNPETPWRLKVPLWLYWLVSGYGERSLRPLLWAGGLLAVSTGAYLWWELFRLKGAGPVSDPFLHWANAWEVALYSLRVMILLKPTNFEPVGFWGNLINTAQTIFGPLLFGLFALALRQRLKR